MRARGAEGIGGFLSAGQALLRGLGIRKQQLEMGAQSVAWRLKNALGAGGGKDIADQFGGYGREVVWGRVGAGGGKNKIEQKQLDELEGIKKGVFAIRDQRPGMPVMQ